LLYFLVKTTLRLTIFFSRRQNIQANSLRIYNMSRGVKTPNSPSFISTVHNEARFKNLKKKIIPSRLLPRPQLSKDGEAYRKAKLALKCGEKYKSINLERKAELLRAVKPAKFRLSREARREILDKTLKLFNTCKE